jgi:hypothetical protein
VLAQGLGGRCHQELNDQLIRYALPTLRWLVRNGQIFAKCRLLGRPAPEAGCYREFTDDDREDFVADMIVNAIPVFTRAVFEERKWLPEVTLLRTYFVNGCALQFPALYRRWLNDLRHVQPGGLVIEAGLRDPQPGVAARIVLRDEAARALAGIDDPQVRRYTMARAAGYSTSEAAALAGLTPKAAEGRLYRIRQHRISQHPTKQHRIKQGDLRRPA